MTFDAELLDKLTAEARRSPRLRMNFDLRNSPADGSQRMLNALEPGTALPIHRHRKSSETVVILRGSATQYFYDESGRVTEEVTIAAGSGCVGMSVEAGRWHRIESLESGTVIMECKDGAYEPIGEEDILSI
jgi:cupin fold WbuC family metalloprotein